MKRLISIVPNITRVFITWQQFKLLTRMYAALRVCARNNLAAIKIVRVRIRMQNDCNTFCRNIAVYIV